MITNEGRLALLVELKYALCLSFFVSTAVPVDYEGLLKCLFYLKM